ncbi:MAG: hypothetical protein NVS9B1_03220 [Candidatus Dormibacteraceae bacterium]
MTARGVAVWSASALACVLLTNNPVYRVLVLLAALNFVIAIRPRGGRALVVGLTAAAAFAVLLNTLLAHAGTHRYATLPPGLPLIGGPLTIESALYGLDIAAALVGAVLAVAPLSLAADPADLVDALPAGLERTGAALAAALGFVPGVGRTLVAVAEAQRMRGWRPRGPRSLSEVLVPVMLTAIEDSIQLAESMAARAYGAGPRTHYPGTTGWTAADVIVAAASVIALAGYVGLTLSGAVSDWYPYPSLAFPPVNPLAVPVLLLLTLPVFAWRSRS